MRLESDDAARKLISRSVLSHGIYSLWASADTYEALKSRLLDRPDLLERHAESTFSFQMDCFQGSRSTSARNAIIESFAYMKSRAKVRLRDPDLAYTIFENYAMKVGGQPAPDKTPRRIHLGTFVGPGGRDAIALQDLKKRTYISTTSMDAALALVTANMALAAPGKLCYDPFAGTGGFPLACAHYGAHTLASDIDGRNLKGTSKAQGKGPMENRNVKGNFRQYNLLDKYVDGFISDLTNSPLRLPKQQARSTRWLDAIVCDPPYGVREGLKVLGSHKPDISSEAIRLADGQLAHL